MPKELNNPSWIILYTNLPTNNLILSPYFFEVRTSDKLLGNLIRARTMKGIRIQWNKRKGSVEKKLRLRIHNTTRTYISSREMSYSLWSTYLILRNQTATLKPTRCSTPSRPDQFSASFMSPALCAWNMFGKKPRKNETKISKKWNKTKKNGSKLKNKMEQSSRKMEKRLKKKWNKNHKKMKNNSKENGRKPRKNEIKLKKKGTYL